jgi:hypothetical protein
MPRHGCEVKVYAGPLLNETVQPVVAAGADYVPGAGWTDITSLVADPACDGNEHESVLTLTVAGFALDTGTFVPDRMILLRARQWDDTLLAWGPWSVQFNGHCTGLAQGDVAGGEIDPEQAGTVECRQFWHLAGLQHIPAATYGPREIARGRPTTASSTLADPSVEAPLEYASAASVAADQAVDGNRDTVWISNNVANPTPPVPWDTGRRVKIMRLYDGTGGAGVLGANGDCRALELRCDHRAHDEGFESSTGLYAEMGGPPGTTAQIQRTTAWAASGSWSLLVTGQGGARLAEGGGVGTVNPIGGMAPEVEAECSFVMRGHGGPATVEFLLSPGASGGTEVRRFTAPADRGIRFSLRRATGNAGQMSLRWKFLAGASPAATIGFYLDDIRLLGGVELEQSDNKGLYLWFDDRRGNTGCTRLSDVLDMDSIGGGQSLILTDDAELFRQRFDAGDAATVVQWRNLPPRATQNPNGLQQLDFASGRGRLTMVMWRRFNAPDSPTNLVGDGGEVWDDIGLEGLPTFGRTEALRRTGAPAGAWAREANPGFGGAAIAGTAWLRVDLGSFPATVLTATLGTAPTGTLNVTATDGYRAAGWHWIDNERLYLVKSGPTTFAYSGRSGAVGHAIGASVYPDQDGQRITIPLVAAIGLRRRAGVPAVRDFSIIGSVLPSPRDPATPDPSGGVWGEHDDWFPLVAARGNTHPNPTYVIGREGDWQPDDTPDARDWGRPLRWLQIVVDAMADGGRAKINEVMVWAADLDSGGTGAWAGTSPPDLRGVVGHLVVHQGGLPAAQYQVDRGFAGLDLPWGMAYGTLPIAPGTIDEIVSDLEQRGVMRLAVQPGGIVRLLPDPLGTAAAFQAPEHHWTGADIWRLSIRRKGAHAVSQARVTARNEGEQVTLRAAFPRTPQRYGSLVDVADVLMGTQAQVNDHAIRVYRQSNAPWAVDIDTGYVSPLTVWARHTVTYEDADRAGLVFSGHNFYLAGFSWRVLSDDEGQFWTTSASLESLEPFA